MSATTSIRMPQPKQQQGQQQSGLSSNQFHQQRPFQQQQQQINNNNNNQMPILTSLFNKNIGQSTSIMKTSSGQSLLANLPSSIANDQPSPPLASSTSFLMQKLHSKRNEQRSWSDLSRSVKQFLMDKRSISMDERQQLQKSLDTMQKNIEVRSIATMLERLETICRQLNLKFAAKMHASQCFIYSSIYYVEIKFNQEKESVDDCQISHNDKPPMVCTELIDVLNRRDFFEFTKHLEGLAAIYKIKADRPVTEKAYQALDSLEKDLEQMAEIQKNQINDINNLVHRSPIGVLESRKGGHPMKLTFFVQPYDLLDLEQKISLPLTVDIVIERKIGYSAQILLEDSVELKRLQSKSLIIVKQRPDGKNLAHFLEHNEQNSELLPACYVLRLTRTLPISLDLLNKIQKLTGINLLINNDNNNCNNNNEPQSMITLLTNLQLNQSSSSSSVANSSMLKSSSSSSSFLAILPDQRHCYYVNNIGECHYDQQSSLDCSSNSNGGGGSFGILLERLPFTHPSHVSRILVYLRQQVLFNVILGSIIRKLSLFRKNNNESSSSVNNHHIFEVSYFGLTNIYVQFEHPLEQSLATMEIDLKDITQVRCKLYANSSSSSTSSLNGGTTNTNTNLILIIAMLH
ncbi:Mediator of RNA polymerase II transcription subunit 1 [Dermatophagoides pteronyssinus]|uniref:Mediator of RNA polymerase II transcription subunit 1 n=1 Tax=Dermatophagoides pteronyssinus TaxID=6956 RepID=A0ABQ8IT23_DERPT|nr:Mediator of RNA polymerase II transcription subunit 1 [Dermatophagoides pteronyssinus]